MVSKPGSRFVTLFLHGNAGNATHRIDHARAINQAGSAALILDYRGYRKSKGHPSERGLQLDADAAYDAVLQRGYDSNEVLIHAESLGTAIAADLASRRACAGLILEAPLAGLGEMAARIMPIVGPLFVNGFNTRTTIQRVRIPVFVLHGDADEIVAFSQGQAVFAPANQPKGFWRIQADTTTIFCTLPASSTCRDCVPSTTRCPAAGHIFQAIECRLPVPYVISSLCRLHFYSFFTKLTFFYLDQSG